MYYRLLQSATPISFKLNHRLKGRVGGGGGGERGRGKGKSKQNRRRRRQREKVASVTGREVLEELEEGLVEVVGEGRGEGERGGEMEGEGGVERGDEKRERRERERRMGDPQGFIGGGGGGRTDGKGSNNVRKHAHTLACVSSRGVCMGFLHLRLLLLDGIDSATLLYDRRLGNFPVNIFVLR